MVHLNFIKKKSRKHCGERKFIRLMELSKLRLKDLKEKKRMEFLFKFHIIEVTNKITRLSFHSSFKMVIPKRNYRLLVYAWPHRIRNPKIN